MSQQATQPGATELDASIDALFDQLEPGAPAPSAEGLPPELGEPPAEFAAPEPAFAPPISSESVPAPAMTEQPDAMLDEVSQEIERQGPSAVESSFSFQEPSAEELRVEAPAPTAAPPSIAPPPAPANIARLDAALAANADQALAAAQEDLAGEPESPPEPAAPVAVAASVPAPEEIAPIAPEAVAAHHDAQTPAALSPEPEHAAAVEVPATPRPPLSAALLAPLRPLAAIHERLGESTRQTIGYCAILTLFSAACAWGLPLFLKKPEMDPARGEQPFIYNDTIPAHGVKAPARHGGDSKDAAHASGSGGGGHGEASKKDSHAKPEKKSSSRSKKSSKTEKAGAHGGH